jgi:putative hydrolase of the HAD superfamily
MVQRDMKIRAVIFDVYQTLLNVQPPALDAEGRWQQLWKETFARPAPLTLLEFSHACDEIIAREHESARARGIAYPEIYWPNVAREAMPELNQIGPEALDDFLFRQSQLWHNGRLMPGAGDVLRALRQRAVLLGIASNSQPYTLRELDQALATASLDRSLFEPDLCFWSFQHGFSKPDPHVFRLLRARLAARDIKPFETMMVGDREDNDMTPARTEGWRTWQLVSGDTSALDQGNWPGLARELGLG